MCLFHSKAAKNATSLHVKTVLCDRAVRAKESCEGPPLPTLPPLSLLSQPSQGYQKELELVSECFKDTLSERTTLNLVPIIKVSTHKLREEKLGCESIN